MLVEVHLYICICNLYTTNNLLIFIADRCLTIPIILQFWKYYAIWYFINMYLHFTNIYICNIKIYTLCSDIYEILCGVNHEVKFLWCRVWAFTDENCPQVYQSALLLAVYEFPFCIMNLKTHFIHKIMKIFLKAFEFFLSDFNL